MTEKDETPKEDKDKEVLSPMQFYANIIAEKFIPAENENDYDVESSAEHLLLKWCSEPPTLTQVNDLVNQLRLLGFKPTALKKSNNFELVYLLKNK
jgi:hypothetical protein